MCLIAYLEFDFSGCEYCSGCEIFADDVCDEIMHHFDKNDDNYRNESDAFCFYISNLILLLF